MKKRILSAVALLCMVICLSGCSSNQGVDVNSIEWVTEDYEDYFTFQVPLEWSGEHGMYSADEDSSVPGSFYINNTLSYILNPNSFSPLEDFVESETTNLDSNETLVEQERISIGGRRGYRYVIERRGELDNEEYSYQSVYYAFEAKDTVFSLWFGIFTDNNVRKYIVDSIQINN